MKLYWFSEMPHHEFPEGEDEKYPSMRLEMPNTFFNREAAARTITGITTSTSWPTRSASTG